MFQDPDVYGIGSNQQAIEMVSSKTISDAALYSLTGLENSDDGSSTQQL